MKYTKLRNKILLLLFTVIISSLLLGIKVISEQRSEAQKNVEPSYVVKANDLENTAEVSEKNTLENIKEEAPAKTNEQNNVLLAEGKKDGPIKTKTAYLTFDDGPTYNNTPAVLDILLKENVKATFFVIGSMAEKNPEVLRREKAEGHVIANHTYSHNYKYIYSSPQNYLKDLKKAEEVITSIVGDYNKTLTRFPGGSFGRQAYKAAVEKAGYKYVDWNSLNGDAEGKKRTPEELINRVKESSENKDNLIILMHDAPGKETTVQALPDIIQYLKKQGYEFKVLE